VFDHRAFTLLEILFVLLIVAFLTAATLKHWDSLIEHHQTMAVVAGVAELNARETFIWAKTLVSEPGWQDDDGIFMQIDTDLGKDFTWQAPGPSAAGGRLAFQNRFVEKLERLPSTAQNPGRWRIHEP
jgi:prepilin-type N-terminal cleavage/methylation domain-containing protein